MPRPAYESSRADARMWRPALVWLWALALVACSESTALVVRDAPDTAGGGMDASAADAGGDAGEDAGVREPAKCGRHACECDNGEDDDGDELIDGLDPECTGPFDDDEESFATGTASGPREGCQDCFFDGNDDPADDGCEYAAECLTGPLPSAGQADCSDCAVTALCENTCRPRTPNGCDCFGCCGVTRSDGSVVDVLLGDECSVKKVDDESVCLPCTQHPTCRNECGVCELCPGKKRKELPMECRGQPEDDEPSFSCDEGEQVCDEERPCPLDFYCQLGCCLFIPQ